MTIFIRYFLDENRSWTPKYTGGEKVRYAMVYLRLSFTSQEIYENYDVDTTHIYVAKDEETL